MKRYQILAIVVLGISTLCASAAPTILSGIMPPMFNPKRPPVSDWSVGAAKLHAEPGKEWVVLRIEDPVSGDKSVRLPETMAQLDSVEETEQGDLILIGRANAYVSVVAILRRRENSISDSFLAYRPAPSPNGKWIAFEEFFPNHAGAPRNRCYRLYDVYAGARSNRRRGGDAEEPRLVGRPVYPAGGQVGEECPADARNASLTMSPAAFQWRADSQAVAFGLRGDSSLLLVTLQYALQGAWQAAITDLDASYHACRGACSDVVLSIEVLEGRPNLVRASASQRGAAPLEMSIPWH